MNQITIRRVFIQDYSNLIKSKSKMGQTAWLPGDIDKQIGHVFAITKEPLD
jgi:hypothetical protein